MRNIVTSVEESCRDYRLVEKGDKILVAFSGGPDSTALLNILNRLSKRMGFTLCACHINHNIRPKAIGKEIAFCLETCAQMKVPLTVVDADVPRFSQERKKSLEEAGREFRYFALARMAENERCNKIALGHHRDDIIETILFRLFRGTGPGGMWPIKPKFSKLIRPLFEISRIEIEQWLKRHKIDYMLDLSNMKENFSRNYIRRKIIPLIEAGFGTKFKSGIIKFAKITAEENKYLAEIAIKKFQSISKRTPGGKIVIDLDRLAAYDLWLRRRIIRLSLQILTGHPGAGSFEEVERIESMINGNLMSVNLQGGISVVRDRDSLLLAGKKCRFLERSLTFGRKLLLPEINSKLICRVVLRSENIFGLQKRGHKVSMDYDKIDPPLYVRGIHSGDRFDPLGMRGNKKIGDFLTDRKVSRYIRDEIPLVFDQRGIIWLVGYQIAERCKIDRNTRNVLEIELLRGRRNGKAKI